MKTERRPAMPPAPRRRTSRAALLWLAAALLLPPPAVAADQFTPAQHREIEQVLRDYLAQHPEVLLDALQTAEAKADGEARQRAQAALVEQRHEIFADPATPVGGNPSGDVSLVEFFDYQCPYCKEVEPSLEALLRHDKELRFVYKEFPVLGPASVTAARAALAAGKQGKYAAFHQAMMAVKGKIDEAAVLKTAASVGLDTDRLKRDMQDPAIDAALNRNLNLAETLDIRGTPGFVIGKTIVAGAISLDDLQKLIAEVRKKAGGHG
jgi:protein-disulfide isomerase